MSVEVQLQPKEAMRWVRSIVKPLFDSSEYAILALGFADEAQIVVNDWDQ
jgi:hypothetical protein